MTLISSDVALKSKMPELNNKSRYLIFRDILLKELYENFRYKSSLMLYDFQNLLLFLIHACTADDSPSTICFPSFWCYDKVRSIRLYISSDEVCRANVNCD